MVINRFKLLLFFAAVTHYSAGFGQNPEQLASEIDRYRRAGITAEDREMRRALNDSLLKAVHRFLDTPESFDHRLENIEFLGDLRAPDDAFRIITWNFPLEDGTYHYYAFLQLENESYYYLNERSGNNRRPETKRLHYEDWYGALYYEIIPFKRDKERYYALLGWDGYDRFTSRKVIDVVLFNEHDEPVFGAPVFLKGENSMKTRVILEFKKDAAVSLKYHEKDKRIVFNHLEPLNAEMEGIYQFYAPNLEFDAYTLNRKGEWIFEENVDIIVKTKKIFNDPRPIKEPVEKPGNPKN